MRRAMQEPWLEVIQDTKSKLENNFWLTKENITIEEEVNWIEEKEQD